MTPSPTFRDRQRERERRNRDRRDRERSSRGDRKSDKDRRRSDVFKGSLSEGQTLAELEGGKLVDDVQMNDIEIPMDSDDEEAKIEELRKRRELRRKMMVNVVEQEESPGSSPRSRVASPLEKVRSSLQFNIHVCIFYKDQRAAFIKRLRVSQIPTCVSLQRQK